MDGIKASSVYTNAEKDVMIKILSSSSGKTYYSGFRTAAKNARQKVEARKPKNDEERAKMVLEEMAKDGFKVSDITTFNSILKFADQYLKR
jgi:ribosomal protein S20